MGGGGAAGGGQHDALWRRRAHSALATVGSLLLAALVVQEGVHQLPQRGPLVAARAQLRAAQLGVLRRTNIDDSALCFASMIGPTDFSA